MNRARLWLRRTVIGMALALAILAGALATIAASTVPPLSGTLKLAALTAPVAVVRDANAVPHVFGASVSDLYRGLGFAHAQDRLWQMELLRRAAQGRLSEVLGERTVDVDVFLRTLGLYRAAERSFERLPQVAKDLLSAYAEGVNGFLSRPTGLLETRLPPEFLLLRFKPEPWRPADSIAVIKMMALNLGANLGAEIQRLTLAAQGLNPAEIEDVMPLNADEHPPPLPDIARLYPLRALDSGPPPARNAALEGLLNPPGASNSWVVAGSRTLSGHPLLANDPHLRLSAPSIWYLAHLGLEPPGQSTINLLGASLPGTPVIVLGRGHSLAWGFTNAGTDVQDIFIEKVNPDNPGEYLTPVGWRPFEVEDMEIRIAGGGRRIVQRRATRHGPVLPASFRNLGRILGPSHVAALQWTALSGDDTTIAAGLFDPSIRTVEAFLDRTRYYVVPMQSMVVADTRGRIAMAAPGRVPVRDPANVLAGRAPVPGWEGTYDWKGFVPFAELPRVVDPASGAIGTANARIVDHSYPHLLTFDWEADYRQRRIRELVLERTGHDMPTMRAAQLDVRSLAFAELLPLMLDAARPLVTRHTGVLDQLASWDATMRADAVEPLLFAAWLRESVRAVFADDLGPAFDPFFAPRARAMVRLLRGEASSRDWCDDVRTPTRESCGEILARALSSAIEDLERRYGSDRSRWTWGSAHYALGENQVFARLPLVGRLFNIGTSSPGGPYTLNRGAMDFSQDDPFANRHASTFRAIYDLGNLDRSLFMQSTGQSGNPFSRYYRTFEQSWSEGHYIEIPTDRAAIERQAIGTWRLEPVGERRD
jgi:penicillin amidase